MDPTTPSQHHTCDSTNFAQSIDVTIEEYIKKYWNYWEKVIKDKHYVELVNNYIALDIQYSTDQVFVGQIGLSNYQQEVYLSNDYRPQINNETISTPVFISTQEILSENQSVCYQEAPSVSWIPPSTYNNGTENLIFLSNDTQTHDWVPTNMIGTMNSIEYMGNANVKNANKKIINEIIYFLFELYNAKNMFPEIYWKKAFINFVLFDAIEEINPNDGAFNFVQKMMNFPENLVSPKDQHKTILLYQFNLDPKLLKINPDFIKNSEKSDPLNSSTILEQQLDQNTLELLKFCYEIFWKNYFSVFAQNCANIHDSAELLAYIGKRWQCFIRGTKNLENAYPEIQFWGEPNQYVSILKRALSFWHYTFYSYNEYNEYNIKLEDAIFKILSEGQKDNSYKIPRSIIASQCMIMQFEKNQRIQYINLEKNELPPMLEHIFMQSYLERRDPALNGFDIIPGRADLLLDQLAYNDSLESEESDNEEWEEDEDPQVTELKKQIKTLTRELEKTTISSPSNHVKTAHSKTTYLEKPEPSKKHRKNISNKTVPQNLPEMEVIQQKAPETHFKLWLPTLIWRRKNVIKLSGFNETMVQHIYPHDSFKNLEPETLDIGNIQYTKKPESKNIKKVAKDGNCLFRALAYCITGIDYVLDQMHEDATNVHKKMREATCHFLEQNRIDTNIINLVLSRIDSPQDQSNPVDAYLKMFSICVGFGSNKKYFDTQMETVYADVDRAEPEKTRNSVRFFQITCIFSSPRKWWHFMCPF
uniref:OTU domain-containing protein n=1 Tax=Acrobeloides nanus TaxID=290746 RepID=A0A914DP61_9BILA